jgi:hypothetical protein
MAFQTKGKSAPPDRELRCGELDLAVESFKIGIGSFSSKRLREKGFYKRGGFLT